MPVNLNEIRKELSELRTGLNSVRNKLKENFADLGPTERYSQQMWPFINKAKDQLDDLTDDVKLANTTFHDVLTYFGEEDNGNLTSADFFKIFGTFCSSYKVCILFCRGVTRRVLSFPRRNARATIEPRLSCVWLPKSGSKRQMRCELTERRFRSR